MEKVIITGINGFVGGNLKKYLYGKYCVTGVSRNKKKDILSLEELTVDKLNNYKAFIHLAGKAHDLKGNSNSQEYYDVNTNLTKTLFDKFTLSDCEIFIYISSVKAVKDKIDCVLTEDVEGDPITDYGKSKLLAEKYILSEAHKFTDKKVYILRPCMIHGPNNKGNLNLLFNMINKGVPYPLGGFNNKRSFISVNNLCYLMDQIILKTPESDVYNVADDGHLSTNELVKLIGESISKPSTILNVPKNFIKIIAKIGDYIPIPINSHKLDKLTENYVVSNAKLKNRLVINNLPLSIEDGIINTIKSFK